MGDEMGGKRGMVILNRAHKTWDGVSGRFSVGLEC